MFSVIVYGEFRTFEVNLRENLKELFGEIAGPIHFYILTEDCDGYADKKKQVIDIISGFGYNIMYFERISECSLYDSEVENSICLDYHSIPSHQSRDAFTPKLYYRKALINQVMNSLTKTNGFTYDKVVSVRLFDMIYKRCKSLSFLNKGDDEHFLYYGVDSLFIGSKSIINKLYSLEPISKVIQLDDMNKFQQFYYQNDFYLSQVMPRLALETIYQSLIYKYFLTNSMNLRFDYTRHNINQLWNNALEDNTNRQDIIDFATPFIQTDYLFVLHCPRRK